jgi:hypothetical protein
MEPEIRLPATQLREYEFENELAPCRVQPLIEYYASRSLALKVVVIIIITIFRTRVWVETTFSHVLRVRAGWVDSFCPCPEYQQSNLVLDGFDRFVGIGGVVFLGGFLGHGGRIRSALDSIHIIVHPVVLFGAFFT